MWDNTTIKTKGNEMKILKTVIATAIVLGSFTAVFANESIDTQIANIKGATAQERVQLMNEFKVKLAEMNAQDRADAINQLRSQVQVQKRTQTGEQSGTQEAMQTRTRTRTQASAEKGTQEGLASEVKLQKQEMAVQAISQTDQMNQVQNMNQIHMMSQQQMGSMVGDLPMDPASMPMSPGVLPGSTTLPSVPTTTVQPTSVTMPTN